MWSSCVDFGKDMNEGNTLFPHSFGGRRCSWLPFLQPPPPPPVIDSTRKLVCQVDAARFESAARQRAAPLVAGREGGIRRPK